MTRQKWCIVQPNYTLYLLIKELYFCDDTGTETKLFLSASKPATRIPISDFSQTRR